MKLEIESEKLINLDLFSYFICLALFKNDTNSLIEYCKLHPISEKSFENAIQNGYLSSNRKQGEDFFISNIKLLPKFSEEYFPIKKTISFDDAWAMILNHYPNKVGFPGKIRYLHKDVDGAKAKYKQYIYYHGEVNEEEHSFILQAINYISNMEKKNNNCFYMEGLHPFINQKNWERVREEVNGLISKYGFVKRGDDTEGERFETI